MLKKMNLFSYSDYKKFLKDKISENRALFGYKTKLAKAANCQKSFLSVVLSSHTHLTIEHAFGLSSFFQFNRAERDFFIHLLQFARAGTIELKKYYSEKMQNQKLEHENFGKRFPHENIVSEGKDAGIYYSNWTFAAIHILLTIPEYQTDSAIAKKLLIPLSQVRSVLRELADLGLAKKGSGVSWQATKMNIHIAKDSYLNQINHSNWRRKAEENIAQKTSDSVHYTGIYSLSRADLELLRDLIFDLVERSRKIAIASPEEELVCFACDFFRVSAQ